MSDKNTLVLLPGLHGSVRLFEPLVRHLRLALPHRDLLPIPLPATGRQDYAALAAALGERLTSLGPISLIAESFSGPLAMHLAADPRVRVESLVLAASFCGAPHPTLFSLMPLRPLFAMRAPKPVIRRFLTGPKAADALVADVRTEVQATRGKVLAERVRTVLSLDPDTCPLPPAHCRTLLLQAQQDALLPWEAQSEIERRLPDARVEWIDGPHLLLQVRAADCAQRIATFLGAT